VPTTAGVAAVACVPPTAGAGGFARHCASVADTLRIRGARAYPVGPSHDYANALDYALSQLQQRARTHAAGLESAATPAARAQAMQTLAGDYDSAARSLERLDLSPADQAANGRLVAALSRTSRAYRQAAEAAGRGDAAAVKTGRTRIDGGETAIDGALASLEAVGYGTDGGGAGSSAPADAGPGDSQTPQSRGDDSGVGDSRSDDPSDDEPDEDDNGD